MLSKDLYIFPTSRSIREYILQSKSVNQFLPKYITIGDFFSRTLLTKNKKQIDKDLRILYLQDAISNSNIAKLGLSTNFSKFYAQSEYIFKFFNELNSEFKSIEELEDADSYALYIEHLDILKSIYSAYVKILNKNDYVDNITLPLDYVLNENYLNEFEHITLYYEGYFSSFEFSIITQIATIKNVYIELIVNEFNQKNIDVFKKINIDLEINKSYTLDITNQKIKKESPYDIIITNNVIYPVQQRINQIAVIKYAIANMIDNGIEAHKILVLLPDESFDDYVKLFDAEKYFNFAMGNNIDSSYTKKRANALNNYFLNKEPKDILKLAFNSLDEKHINDLIGECWNEELDKKLFFEIIDYLCLDEKNEEIKEKILEIKLSLENLLFNMDFSNTIMLKDAFKIFYTKLGEITLDDVQGGSVTVLGILETRYINYEGVIVVDFNDDKIPKRSVKDKFLSTQVKQKADLPTITDRQNLQKYYYKRLLDGAKQIVVTYVHNEQNTISRFSKQIFLKQNIHYKDFSKIMQNSKELNLFNDDIKIEINLSTQEWSATSLKAYLECKRKYYLSYIKKIKEHRITLKPAAYELGQIIHDVLEKYYKQDIRTYKHLCDEISRYQGHNPYLTLDLELWKKKLEVFVKKEYERFEDGVTISSLEMPFSLEYKGIRIKGKIDRVDKLHDNTYAILDYKTSSTLKIDSIKNYEESKDFQLEFYFLALREVIVSKVAYYDLNDASIKEEILLKEKIERLDEIFLSLNTKSVNFEKCEDKKYCTFCTYKVMCGRE